jgi:hypothetical protein
LRGYINFITFDTRLTTNYKFRFLSIFSPVITVLFKVLIIFRAEIEGQIENKFGILCYKKINNLGWLFKY